MATATSSDRAMLREAVAKALEAARSEVVKRLESQNLPLTVEARELQIVATHGGGWSGEWTTVSISPLRIVSIEVAVQDGSVPTRLVGLRPQLEELAQLLNETTDLGTRPANLLPASTGVEAILARYLTGLARAYLTGLPNLREPDQGLVTRLIGELEELVQPENIRRTYQLAMEGVDVTSPLEHRGVRLRPLTPAERGHYYQSRSGDELYPYQGQTTDFVVPREFANVLPSALLETSTTRPRNEPIVQSKDQATLLNRVALAFYLKDFDIAGTGIIVAFDRPLWATFGQSSVRSLVDEKLVTVIKPITSADFKAVVDLAYKMPEFGPAEASSREIILYRTLRGLGIHWQESGFLDLAIALEAALLKGLYVELSYRLSLYGALFLRDVRDPEETFGQLRNIYDVRSRLVHGSPIDAPKRAEAISDTVQIAKGVVLKGIEDGWPDTKRLDRVALTTPTVVGPDPSSPQAAPSG